MEKLFTRHGSEFTGKPHTNDEGGKPHTYERHRCGRCGGAGGSDKWAHTGWTCYECGGSGKGPVRMVKLYTAAQNAKLDAIKTKRLARKFAQTEVARKQAEGEREIRRAEFVANYSAFLERVRPYAEARSTDRYDNISPRYPFIADVYSRAWANFRLTPAQANAVEAAIQKIEATEARKAASGHVGKVGERRRFTVVAERVARIATQFGTLYISTMRDGDGNAIVSKGRYVPATATWNHDLERFECSKDSFTITATIKEHSSYGGEAQTIVQRVKDIEEQKNVA
jgi:hypothetical protein